MKRKLIVLFFGLILSYVSYISFASNGTYGTDIQYIADGEESYYIEVPAKLSPGESGNVRVYGTWPSNKIISVESDKTVTLVNSLNSSEKQVLNINFNNMQLVGSNIAQVDKTESISISQMPNNVMFGNWKGRFDYNVTYKDNDISFKFGEMYVLTYISDFSLENSSTFPDYVVINRDGSGYMSCYAESVVLEEYEAGEIMITGDNSIIGEDEYMRQTLYVYNDGDQVDMIYTDLLTGQSIVMMRFVRYGAFDYFGSNIQYVQNAQYFNENLDNSYVLFSSNYEFSLNDLDTQFVLGPVKYYVIDNTVFGETDDQTEHGLVAIGQFSNDGQRFVLYDMFNAGRNILSTYVLDK